MLRITLLPYFVAFFFVLTVVVSADETASDSDFGSEVVVRDKRNTVSFFYLCGRSPNQFLSNTPCNCNNCRGNVCQVGCTNSNFCISRNRNWRCIDGCCRLPAAQTPATTRRPNPTCGGREVSGGFCRANRQCSSGFLCTNQNVCCRCAFGTSVGRCVNGQCPNNTQCNRNNECCPFQTGK